MVELSITFKGGRGESIPDIAENLCGDARSRRPDGSTAVGGAWRRRRTAS